MKNRNSSPLHQLSQKYSDPDLKKTSDRVKRNKSASNSFLQKGARILQSYSTYLTQSLYQGGDPDAYFKQTLRNYDLDFGFTGSDTHDTLNRTLSSINGLKPERRRSASNLASGDNKFRGSIKTARSSRPASSKHTQRTPHTEDDDTDIFYSPSSELTTRSAASRIKMAEEEDIPEEEMEEGIDEDPLQETENLVKKAEDDLDKLDETLVQEGEDLEPITEPTTSVPLGGDTTEPGETTDEEMLPTNDEGILKEVAECEAQCTEISKILVELRQRVTTLLSKASRSPEEDRELEQKQRELNEKMLLLEQKTKKVEYLMTLSRKKATFDQPQTEDVLPKVIICGVTDNNVPKIIVCDDKKKKKKKDKPSPYPKGLIQDIPECECPTDGSPPPIPPKLVSVTGPVCPMGSMGPMGAMGPMVPGGPPSAMMPAFAQRLCESYNMQEKLAAENADLEGKRYQLQSDLLNKDQTVESLQRKLASLQTEMRMVVKENTILNDKLERQKGCPPCSRGDTPRPSSRGKKSACGKGKGVCPADVKGRLDEYSETTQQLEKQLSDMEDEVRKMQNELISVRQERLHLEQHRRLLCQQPPPCAPPPCGVPPCGVPPCGVPPCGPPPHMPCPAMMKPPPCPGPCNPNRPSGISADQQLRELREQYTTLQDDYKGKLMEVAGLRADVDKLKQVADGAEEARKAAEDKSKECERLLKDFKLGQKKLAGSKEQLVEIEQQLSIAKQRYRETKDELEEVRALVEDQKAQLEDYRNKYLQAQQQVEEQRRQIDMMELENGRISEQVNLEIQRVKNQFQEKLQELTPLPDILKATQLKLQEAQQMHLLAERNNESLVRELQVYKDKAAAMFNEMDKAKSMAELGEDEKMNLLSRIEELQAKCNELTEDNERMKSEMMRLEEVAEDAEKMAKEKMHEIAQLSAEVDNVREESARQVARTKDRCETVRRSMQNQIADLERQLAQSRAQARSAQKDKDEIRQKMQSQISNLNENFEDAQMRIRTLQGHVNFLKTTYTNVFPAEPNVIPSEPLDPCNCANPKF